MWDELGKYFRDPRLRQLFGRYATYCGSSPFLAPATLMLVAHVEMDGVWRVEGGMHRLAVALADLAHDRGARIFYGQNAKRILVEGGRATGVETEQGEIISADAVVMNGDAGALRAGLLGAPAIAALNSAPRAQPSLSAVTFAMRAQTRGFPLVHHNVFFSRDYRAEFDDIFRDRRLPRAPTVYVCAQDRGDEDVRSSDERLFALVNAPAVDGAGELSTEELRQCEEEDLSISRRLWSRHPGAAAGDRAHDAQGFRAALPGDGRRDLRPGVARLDGLFHAAGIANASFRVYISRAAARIRARACRWRRSRVVSLRRV